jgi:hypothetical protein
MGSGVVYNTALHYRACCDSRLTESINSLICSLISTSYLSSYVIFNIYRIAFETFAVQTPATFEFLQPIIGVNLPQTLGGPKFIPLSLPSLPPSFSFSPPSLPPPHHPIPDPFLSPIFPPLPTPSPPPPPLPSPV